MYWGIYQTSIMLEFSDILNSFQNKWGRHLSYRVLLTLMGRFPEVISSHCSQLGDIGCWTLEKSDPKCLCPYCNSGWPFLLNFTVVHEAIPCLHKLDDTELHTWQGQDGDGVCFSQTERNTDVWPISKHDFIVSTFSAFHSLPCPIYLP